MWQVCREALGIEKIIAVEVDHCPQSYGCLLVLQDGGRLIYSGDTLPCQNFKNYALGCKLLIHEATFESGMDEDAKMKKHTTTGQALGLAKEVGAWRTILTHFSPRYSKVSEFSDLHFEVKALSTFDHMRVSFKDLEWTYNVGHLYRKLLSNEDSKQKAAPTK